MINAKRTSKTAGIISVAVPNPVSIARTTGRDTSVTGGPAFIAFDLSDPVGRNSAPTARMLPES